MGSRRGRVRMGLVAVVSIVCCILLEHPKSYGSVVNMSVYSTKSCFNIVSCIFVRSVLSSLTLKEGLILLDNISSTEQETACNTGSAVLSTFNGLKVEMQLV